MFSISSRKILRNSTIFENRPKTKIQVKEFDYFGVTKSNVQKTAKNEKICKTLEYAKHCNQMRKKHTRRTESMCLAKCEVLICYSDSDSRGVYHSSVCVRGAFYASKLRSDI